jgi:hypothetical protein
VAEKIHARVCQCGCGRPLFRKDGFPDFARRFFDGECKKRDKARKQQFRRNRLKGLPFCPTCGSRLREPSNRKTARVTGSPSKF